MSELHPSILNHMRRDALRRDPERSIMPAQRTLEIEDPLEEEPASTTALGRLAIRLNLTGGTGGP